MSPYRIHNTSLSGSICKVTLVHLFIAFYVIIGLVALVHLKMDSYASTGEFSASIGTDYLMTVILGKRGVAILLFQLVIGVSLAVVLWQLTGYLVQKPFFPRMIVISGISILTCGVLTLISSLTSIIEPFITIFPGQTGNPFRLCLLIQSIIFGAWAAWWLSRKKTPVDNKVDEFRTEIS